MTAGASVASRRDRPVLPLAALVIAIASVLDPLSRNLHQASYSDAVPALLATAAYVLLVWLVAAALRRRADAGAALIAWVWALGALYYLELVRHLNTALGGDYSQVRPLPVALAVMAGLTLLLRGRARWHAPANTVVTCMAAALLILPAWRIAQFEWHHGAARNAWDPERAMAEMPALAAASAPAEKPDIYHFVFDRYGSEDTLTRHFGITAPIGPFLESQGFYVAREAFSNYLSTGPSLASTFHMDYLDNLVEDPRVTGQNWHPIFDMLDDSRVGRFLRGQGYRQHQFGSWWVGTYHNPNAYSNRPNGLSEFNMTYFRRTMLMPVLHLLPRTPRTMRLNWDNGQCQRVARQVEEIKALAGRDRRDPPLYVFAHLLLPHGPFVFTPDGSCLTMAESEARGEVQGYADQIAYADTIIEDLVTTLLAEGRPAPVILIQADEGPPPLLGPGIDWQDATDEELRIKFGILAAYRFPDGDHSALRQDISPVNSYRVLLGKTFGLDLPQLPDRMLAFPNHLDIYTFHDVTDRVRCDPAVEGSCRRDPTPPRLGRPPVLP